MNNNRITIGDIIKSFGVKKLAVATLIILFFVAIIGVYNSLLFYTTRNAITENGEFNAVKSDEQFDKYLSSGKDVVRIAEYSLERFMEENASGDEILEYLLRETDTVINSLVPNTTGLYAYIDGVYYDGGGWVPDDDYVPTERPWYIDAVAHKNGIVVVDPYLDMQSGSVIITLARCLSDGKSVVALDLTMEEIQTLTEKASANDDYTVKMVLCSNGTVVAHSDKKELGKNYLDEKDTLGAAIAKKLYNDPEVCFELDFGGKGRLIYAVPIQDDWYSVSVVESENTYLPLRILMVASGFAVIATVMILAVIIFRSGRKDIVANRLNSQLSSSADIYMSLCELDVINNTVSEIKNVNPAIAKAVANCGNNMQEVFFGIMKGLPDSPTKQDAIDFVDLSTINERFEGVKVLTNEYLSYGNIWVRARFVVSGRTPEGRISRILWMLENIDTEKRARDKLTEKAEKLNSQLSSAADIYISLCDLDIINNSVSEIKNANPAIAKAVAACDHNMQDIFFGIMKGLPESPTKQAAIDFADMSVINERLRDTNTATIEYLSYGNIWVRARYVVSERTADGRVSHVLWMLENIDNEKKARDELIDKSERAIAANEAKSAFLSNMSHEIRTPINAVLGMNEMVLRECTDPNILEYSESIRTAGTTLLGLINDILDFSKIEAGKMEIIPVDYDLATVLNDLVNMIRTRADAKGLLLIPEFDHEIPEFLHGDEVRLKQVITNILTNAVKYTEKGSVTFGVTFRKPDDDPDSIMLIVSIKDTGIGIRKEDMAKLFSQFERIEEKRNRSVEGTGLGMSITQSLLSMMDSSLNVESVYGEGSVFSFEIKQGVNKWDKLGDYTTAFKNSVSEHKKYKESFTAPEARVLVVDDTPMNLLVFKNLLKKTEVNIDTAESGDEGILLALKNKYDIIFLDHMMPNKDGIETLKELKASESDINRDTPMICLTANAISGAREKYLEAGFDDYLTKPIDYAKLEEMMYERLPKEKIVTSASEQPAQENRPKRTIPDFVFDLHEIDVFSGVKNSGSEEIFVEVLKTYSSMTPRLLDDIDLYWRDENIEMVTRKLGTLKSSSRTAGAEWIRRLALELEIAGREKDIEKLTAKLPELYSRSKWLCIELSPINAKKPDDEQ